MSEARPAAPQSERPPEGVTAPLGFRAGTARADVRGGGDPRDDVAVLVSDGPAQAAGVFTRNRVKAAPVVISALHLRHGTVRAVVANSGNANACTGARGLGDALQMVQETADRVGCDPAEVLVASTGVIGRALPMDRIRPAIATACGGASEAGGAAAARAILTTDTRPKETVEHFEADGVVYTVGGMAKGAGMIHPDMATLLAFVTTDAAVDAPVLRRWLGPAAARTFNRITIDGDTSTNDSCFVLANGAAGGAPIEPGSAAAALAAAALERALLTLARAIVADAEGATRAFTVEVRGAVDDDQADRAARTVAGSALVKTAIHGADPNWGRILAAVGRSGSELALDRCRVRIGGEVVFERGVAPAADLVRVAAAVAAPGLEIAIDLGCGEGCGRAYGCDLSPEYVRINADYTT